MSGNNKRPPKELKGYKKYVRPVILGCLWGVGAIIAFLLLMSMVMTAIDIPQPLVEPIVILAASLGAGVAGYVSSRIVYGRGFVWAMVCGLILFTMLMLAGMMVLPEGFGTIALVKLLSMLVASATGGIVGTNRRYSRK